MNDQKHIELEVSPDVTAARLDVYLAENLESFSRSRIRKLIEAQLVVVDGQPAKAGLKLKGGQRVFVTVPEDVPLNMAAQEIPLNVVFEDEYLAVIDKPVGMVTHPGAGVTEGTLVNALLHHCRGQLSGISGVLRPGIVHRLDKDTSGLLVIAKEDRAHQGLAEQIRLKTARRVYTCLVEGTVAQDAGVVSKPIGRHPNKRKQMAVVDNGRAAVSHYEVIRRWPAYTLLRVSLETGRTHQIRVHMASIGHPVVGDIVYNQKRTGTQAARAKFGLAGHALHASMLSFTHPITGRLLKFEAPLRADLQKLIDSL